MKLYTLLSLVLFANAMIAMTEQDKEYIAKYPWAATSFEELYRMPLKDDRDLMKAVIEGQVCAVKHLLEQGADPDVREKASSETALMLAAKTHHRKHYVRGENCVEIVTLLLQHGADPEATDSRGRTVLSEESYVDTESLGLIKKAIEEKRKKK